MVDTIKKYLNSLRINISLYSYLHSRLMVIFTVLRRLCNISVAVFCNLNLIILTSCHEAFIEVVARYSIDSIVLQMRFSMCKY